MTSLNLISDRWIPVKDKTGVSRVIAPHEAADPNLDCLDWGRADFNLAGLELLIGLAFLAVPPKSNRDWAARKAPDIERFRKALKPYAPAFELLGDRERFMQELKPDLGSWKFGSAKKHLSVEFLLLDGMRKATLDDNADILVKRDRYSGFAPAFSAMALFTLQAFSPSGGRGHRTSIRGGGPLVSLVDPQTGLWDLIWANVPCREKPLGTKQSIAALPWMRKTNVSRGDATGTASTFLDSVPDQAIEAFFGMPRRIRLVEEDGAITRVYTDAYGNNYGPWVHPLTPCKGTKKEGSDQVEHSSWHVNSGDRGYEPWLGLLVDDPDKELSKRPQTVANWSHRSGGKDACLIVGGWDMDSNKALDFVWASHPVVQLDHAEEELLVKFVQAGLGIGKKVNSAIKKANKTTGHDAAFWRETYADLESAARALAQGRGHVEVATAWTKTLRATGLKVFRQGVNWNQFFSLPERRREDIAQSSRQLGWHLNGWSSWGKELYLSLGVAPVGKGKTGDEGGGEAKTAKEGTA